MGAIKVVLPGVSFSDPSLPILTADSLLVPGSLLLIDFGREETLGLTTTPANGTVLGNLAWEQAAAVIGSGNATTLAGTWEDTLAGHPTRGLIERTLKKGIHVIASQTAMDGVNRHGGINVPTLIKDHIYNNLPSRTFYVSVWGKLTRISTQATADAIFAMGAAASPTASFGMLIQRQPDYNPTGTGFVGAQNVPASNTTGNLFRNLAANNWTGTKPGAVNSECKFWWGQRGGWASFQNNKAASGIIYRLYIEDLTASGRSYATVNALDKALYDAALAGGGRFGSDTHTAVSTIP